MAKNYYIDESGFILPDISSSGVSEDISQKDEKTDLRTFTTLNKCKVCNANIKPSRMKAHLRRVHNTTDIHQDSAKTVANKKTVSKIKRKTGITNQISKIQCNICKTYIKSSDFSDHLNSHFEPRPILPDKANMCPVCGTKLNPKNLSKHLQKVHQELNTDKNHQDKPTQKNTADKKLSANTTKKRQENRFYSSRKKGLTNIASESLVQSFDEERDGSKGLGHMQRDFDGTFGSFPLHDDYGDESEP